MGASEMILKVSQEQLGTFIGKLEKRVTSIENCFQTMKETVANSMSYWQGDAGEAHRSAFLDYQDDYDEVIARVREEFTDMQQILANYIKVNDEAERMAKELPLDLID